MNCLTTLNADSHSLKKLILVGALPDHTKEGFAFSDLPDALQADLAASTEAAIVDVLVRKSIDALRQTGLGRIVVAGGVGANRVLRAELDHACAREGVRVHYPELHLCSDNGAMIALAAVMRLQAGIQAASTVYAFDVKPRWPLDQI